VQSYPYVVAITVVGHGAHAVTIDVSEQVPVALVEVGGQAQVVDGRGEILTDSSIPHGVLPQVPLHSAPTGPTVTASGARAALAALAAAPYALLAHVQSATWVAAHGVVAQLRGGPQIYFGPDHDLGRKWRAAVALLQNSNSAGAAYIDVSDPQRPAAGVSVSTQQARSLGLLAQATTGGSAATASGATGATTSGASGATTSGATGATTSGTSGATTTASSGSVTGP
jgi:cell division septal protein FtsQ